MHSKRSVGWVMGFALVGLLGGEFAHAGGTVCDSAGPDIIVGDIPAAANYPSVGELDAFSIATTSCNVGDQIVDWIASTERHPVIAQNMYRMKDGRFEQVGMSWLKHGFGALQLDACGCGCIPADFQHLGVGCSDPYGAGLNGTQNGLGPRFEVNAFLGQFPYPAAMLSQTGDSIFKRLQVKLADLDPGQNGGGAYFVEAQYVHSDDALVGNHFNNASWCDVTITGRGNDWDMAIAGPTHREEPAIMAWQLEGSANLRIADVPNEGRFYLGWKVDDVGSGQWSYEFALFNLNSDRSAGSFRVPLPKGATVMSHGFHDVDYHSGEPFDGTDWSGRTGLEDIRWETDSFAENPDANALRWGSLYNFRFVADIAPEQVGAVEVGLFKPGKPDSIVIPLEIGAPENDECENAKAVGLGTVAFSTVSANTDGPEEPGCSPISADIWFTHTATCTGDLVVSLCGSGFDTSLALYDSSCPSAPGSALLCDDDSCAGQSQITARVNAGETFLIRVGGAAGDQGNGVLSLTCGSGNDLCTSPFPITDGVTPFSTVGAATDGPASPPGLCNDFGDPQTWNDIWFIYTALGDGALTVTTCEDLGGSADYDTDLAVYDGVECIDLELLGCNDDDPTHPCGGAPSFHSTVVVPVAQGSDYLVRVGGWGAEDEGTGTLFVAGPKNGGQGGFVRGDCEVDDALALADPLHLLEYLFSAGPRPQCLDACDANDDGVLSLPDGLRLLAVLFVMGEPPPAPFPECGSDPSDDDLSCDDYRSCAP